MSGDARLGDADLLAAHARELKAFAGRELATLPRVQASLERTERALQQRLRQWQRRRDEAKAEVRRLRAELDACLAQPESHCGGIASALAAAERTLAEAEREVERSQDGLRRFGAAVGDFGPALQRYRGVLQGAVPQASQALGRHHDQARTYLAQAAGGAAVGGAVGGAAGGGSIGGATGGGPGADGSGGGPGPGGATRLPGSELWVVPMASIDLSDSSVQSEADFHTTSPAEMRAGWNRVQEVLMPLAKSGVDPRSAHPGPLADAYFGSSRPIKLSVGPDGVLRPNNGQHRLFVARQMGLTEVPARLVGPGGTL